MNLDMFSYTFNHDLQRMTFRGINRNLVRSATICFHSKCIKYYLIYNQKRKNFENGGTFLPLPKLVNKKYPTSIAFKFKTKSGARIIENLEIPMM